MKITGQQKIMLNKWQKGILKNKDMHRFLTARCFEIPYNLFKYGSDEDAINYIINNAKVQTNVHKSINFFSSLPYNRITYRKGLKQSGIIA